MQSLHTDIQFIDLNFSQRHYEILILSSANEFISLIPDVKYML